MAASSRFTTNLLTSSGFPPIFVTRIRPSSGEQTNTSTDESDATCPKGTSFDDVTQEELDEYVKEINNRPRKVLGWSTPAEVFHELCSKGAIT